MKFTPDSAKGESEIFVPRERHFPDGFRVIHGKGLTLVYDPSAPSGFRVIANPNQLDASAYRWDASRNRIVVKRWDATSEPLTLKIVPGTRD
jgi:hypothetical protein